MAVALLATLGGGMPRRLRRRELPGPSFDPATACTTDGRMPGAYPDLESWLPTSFQDRAPVNVDSGRSCSSDALGSLAGRGIDELRFAGATWDLDGGAAVTIAVFEAAGLTPAGMIEFYEASARANRKTEKLVAADATVGGLAGRRLDVLQSDGTGDHRRLADRRAGSRQRAARRGSRRHGGARGAGRAGRLLTSIAVC
jgi:hypothetical protein